MKKNEAADQSFFKTIVVSLITLALLFNHLPSPAYAEDSGTTTTNDTSASGHAGAVGYNDQCDSDPSKCYVQGMRSTDVGTSNFAFTIATYLFVLAAVFLSTMLAMKCGKSFLLVKSAVVFVTLGALYYAQEIAYFTVYKTTSGEDALKRLELQKENEVNENSAKNYDIQVKDMQKMKELTKKAALLTRIKTGLIAGFAAAMIAPTTMAIVEEVKYRAAFTAYGTSYLALEGLDKGQLATAITLAGTHPVLAAQIEPVLATIKASTETALTGGIMVSAVEGVPVPPGAPSSPDDDAVKATVIANAAMAVKAESGAFKAASVAAMAELNSLLAIAQAAIPVGEAEVADIMRAQATLQGPIQAAVYYAALAMESLTTTSQTLVTAASLGLLTCTPVPVADNSNKFIKNRIQHMAFNSAEMLMDLFFPKAKAETDLSGAEWLKPLGIGGAVLLAIFASRFFTVGGLLNKMLFTGKARAIFFGITTAFLGTLAGLTGAAADELDKRVEAIDKMIVQLQRLSNARKLDDRLSEKLKQLQDLELFLSEVENSAKSGVDMCVDNKTKKCACGSAASCKKLNNVVGAKGVEGSYSLDFGSVSADLNKIKDATRDANNGDLTSATALLGSYKGMYAAFNLMRRRALSDLVKLPNGKNIADSIGRGIADELNGIAKNNKDVMKLAAGKDASAGAGMFAGVNMDNVSMDKIQDSIGKVVPSGAQVGGGAGAAGATVPAGAELSWDMAGTPPAMPQAEEAAEKEVALNNLKFDNQDITMDHHASIWDLISKKYKIMAFRVLLTKKKKDDSTTTEAVPAPAAPVPVH